LLRRKVLSHGLLYFLSIHAIPFGCVHYQIA